MTYEVQTQMMHTWENCWTDGEGKPVAFATIADAVQAIKDHITDCINAVEGGDMEDSPDPSELRIVGNGRVYEYTGMPWDYQVIGDTPKRIAQLQKERVDYGDCAARAYLNAKGENNSMALCDTDISDLLADLYHLVDSLGFDRDQMEERALGHYTAEKEEYQPEAIQPGCIDRQEERGVDAELARLSIELNAFYDQHGLPHQSADEVLYSLYEEEPRREELCQWLENFIEEWDSVTSYCTVRP